MTPSQYMDALKVKLNAQTDYQLAKMLDIPRQNVPQMREGSRAIPNYLVMKIAITLNLDPAQVLADLEVQREKDPKKKAFWDSFILRVGKVTAVLMLALVFSAGLGSEAGTLGGLNSGRFWGIMADVSIAYN